MSETRNRLSELRGEMSQKKFAESIGLSQQNYWKYENGKQELRSDLIETICRTYDCTAEWLLGFDDARKKTAPDGAMGATGMKMGYAPLVGTVHAGEFAPPDEFQEATDIAIPQFLIDKDPDTFVLLTEGDCMSRAFGEGRQHLAVSPNAEARDGSRVVVRIDDGDLLVRTLRLNINGRRLCAESYNPEYEDIVIPYDSGRRVDLAGVVKWNQSAEEME